MADQLYVTLTCVYTIHVTIFLFFLFVSLVVVFPYTYYYYACLFDILYFVIRKRGFLLGGRCNGTRNLIIWCYSPYLYVEYL